MTQVIRRRCCGFFYVHNDCSALEEHAAERKRAILAFLDSSAGKNDMGDVVPHHSMVPPMMMKAEETVPFLHAMPSAAKVPS